MNDEFLQLGAFQSSEPVPNAEMEIQYMPSNSTFAQQQVTSIPMGQVLSTPFAYDHSNSANLSQKEPEPIIEHEMDSI